MGIPSFYAWLRKRYPLILYNVKDESKQIPIYDNLYIDFNALIYRCVKEQHHFLMDQLSPRQFDEIYERVIEYVDLLIDEVSPQKLLFISVDGVVPRAKVNQSRERRFKAGRHMTQMQELFKLVGVQDQENFKGNSISPGTEFLFNLCARLKTYVLAKMENDWRHLNVVFSDCTVPGEGEQKIMEFLRACIKKNFFPKETTHCIYSPDADFFLLSLSTRLKHIAIIREEFAWSEDKSSAAIRQISEVKFEYVVVSVLREYFEYEFKDLSTKIKNYNIYRIIDDFILIMMFVGNDFLPRMFCFGIREGHLNDLLEKYKEYLGKRDDYINDSGKIDWKNVESLLSIAKEFEAVMIQEKLMKGKHGEDKTGPEDRGKKEWDDEIASNFEVEGSTITKGRNYYYKSRFDINIDDPNDAKKFDELIVKYLEGLEFYCTYYYIGCPSWSWYYPYHYTPLIADVYNYLAKNRLNEVKLPVKGTPFDPLMALMFMLPQQSFGLLPEAIRKELEDQKNPLRSPDDYYTNDFEMDKFSNPKDFDQKALVPFLDETMVRAVYDKIPKDKYTKDEQARNVNNDPLFLRREGEGKLERTGGFQFSLKKDSSINEIIKVMNKPSTESRVRLPTLKIFGDTIKNTKTGFQIIIGNRYKAKNVDDELVFFNNFLGYIEESIALDKEMENKFGEVYGKLGLIGKGDNYYRIKLTRLVRDVDGFKLVKINREVLAPDYVVFPVPDYDYIKKTRPYVPEDWPQVGEKVVSLRKDSFGWLGVVEAVANPNVTIRVVEKSHTLEERVEEIDSIYYTINSVCNALKISKEVLLTFLDEVYVRANKNEKYGGNVPDEFNLGLSIIDRKRGLIVPKYARCDMQYQNTTKPGAIFENLEVTEDCVKIIREYVKQLPEIVDAIDHEFKKYKNFKFLTSEKIFLEKPQNDNLELIKLYLRLYKIQAKGHFYRIYSKRATQAPKWKAEELKPTSTIEIEATHVLSKRQSRYVGLPYLNREPQYHNIGDRVVLLRTQDTGVITGLNDAEVVVRVPKRLREYRFGFCEVFNEKWAYMLDKREKGACWNHEVSYFAPSYWTKTQEWPADK